MMDGIVAEDVVGALRYLADSVFWGFVVVAIANAFRT